MIKYSFVTRADMLSLVAQKISQAPVVGIDIECTSLDPRHGQIRLFQIVVPGADNDGRGCIFVIDLFETKGLGPILDALRTSKAIFVIHNAKFEQKWLWWHYRIKLWPIFCTFRASAIIYNGKLGLRHDLDSVVIRELNEHPVNTGQGGSDWGGVLTQLQKDYSAEDVLRLLPLRTALRAKLVEYGLLITALIEFGVVLAEARTELNGFPVNQKRWHELADANVIERSRIRDELLFELPHPKGQLALPGMSTNWNLDSPQQMLASLKRLGLKITNTPEITLAQHAAKYPPIKKILAYRGVAQRVKTYGENFLRHVEADGRIHADYYGLLATGRYSANKSLQQIPRERSFRSCFAPLPGRIFILADYSGVEMCLCAEISGDEALTQIFLDGLDPHRATAAVILEIPLTAVSPGQRQSAKPVNFGFIYGMMPEKFVLYAMANYGVVVSPAEAKKYRRRYFERYAGVERWHQRALREGERCGFARTLSGRIRYLEKDAHNEYFNTPVQGSGADALKVSLAIVQDQLDTKFGVTPACNPDGPAQIVHHVHDEILLETDDDPEMIRESETLLHAGMKEGMEKIMKRVPTKVDPSHGPSWAEAKH